MLINLLEKYRFFIAALFRQRTKNTYVIFIVLFFFCNGAALNCKEILDKNDIPENIQTRIASTIRDIQREIYDLNFDGKVNCIDYSCMFKIYWNHNYNKNECEIVRNKNPRTGMHHLFIRINIGPDFVLVEPWTKSKKEYVMKHCWDDFYDSYYNYYGETDYWLSKIPTWRLR